MKRVILLILTAAAVLFVTGCQFETPGVNVPAGEEVVVSVDVAMAGGELTRSAENPGDGTLVNRCILLLQISYDEGASWVNYYDAGNELRVAPVESATLTASFDAIRLVTGYDYRLLFWADCATANDDGTFADKYYSTANFVEAQTVSIITTTFGGNNDERDAFWGDHRILKSDFTGSRLSVNKELKRPFGKLNIATTDWDDVPTALKPTHVTVSFTGLTTGLNLGTGEVTGTSAEAIEYVAPVEILAKNETVVTNGRQLSFDYLFASDEQQNLSDFTLGFKQASGETYVDIAIPFTFTNIPLRRNWQTNVAGSLLTDPADVTVTIVPGFDGTEDAFGLSENTRLSSILSESDLLQLTELKIHGTMLKEDFEFISPAVHKFTFPENLDYEYKLETLDLSGATFTNMYCVADDSRSSRNANNVLTTVILPDGVTSISSNAFAFCKALSSINLPEGLITIGDGVFYANRSLTSIELPESLININNHAFQQSGLYSVTTGPNVENLGYDRAIGWVFYDCENLERADLSASTKLTTLTRGLFYNCDALKEVLIPESVTRISKQVFNYCTSLSDITLPEGLTIIGKQAFASCRSLATLELPAAVTTIASDAFSNSISGGITLIMKSSTPPNVCTFNNDDQVTAEQVQFTSAGNIKEVRVPAGALEAYQNHPSWSNLTITESN